MVVFAIFQRYDWNEYRSVIQYFSNETQIRKCAKKSHCETIGMDFCIVIRKVLNHYILLKK